MSEFGTRFMQALYLIWGVMFVGSMYWGDTQDTVFWGVLLILNYLILQKLEGQR